jgi:acyl-coenzyme A thioesterase PaaI-like protein
MFGLKAVSPIERLPKRMRQQHLFKEVEKNPFKTDDDLARQFQVSIQTVRLDRMELGIPELRERMKTMAARTYDQLRSLQWNEVIGDVVDLQLDDYGISILETTEEHSFVRTHVIRGHHIFAQANSLAIAVINEEVALTAAADIRFIRPVYKGERLIAKARVKKDTLHKTKVKVEVRTYIGDEVVFTGSFNVFRAQGLLEGGQP